MKVTLDLGLPCMVSRNFEIKIYKKNYMKRKRSIF